VLLDSVVEYGWPLLQLYIPSFGITETQCVLDRHYLCDWHGAAKDRKYRLTKAEYSNATSKLRELQKVRQLHRLELDSQHLDAASLVSVVNSKYQVRRRATAPNKNKKTGSRVKPPMGAADCLLLGLSIELGLRVGVGDVVVVTADNRMTDVADRCRRLTDANARTCGLYDIALRLGVQWSSELYPRCIHLARCTEAELSTLCGHWPLPTRELKQKTLDQLTAGEEKKLFQLGEAIKTETGVGPDPLPYSKEIDALQIRFSIGTGVYMTKAEIAKRLLRWRKNPASRPT